MGKTLLTVLPLLLLIWLAQDTAAQVNQTADASIEVMGGLSVTKITDLGFGTIYPQAGLTTVTEVNPRTDPNAASFEVISFNGAIIFVSWTVTQPGQGLIFIPEVTSHGSNAALSATLTEGSFFTVSQNNHHYIWVGGKLEVLPDVLPGSYSGTFTISVTY
jgi:hypothetical protein